MLGISGWLLILNDPTTIKDTNFVCFDFAFCRTISDIGDLRIRPIWSGGLMKKLENICLLI